tara:strand:- start:36174 stop:36644 length:471 start_codon:yes stop_codon:yes gene_type:complete
MKSLLLITILIMLITLPLSSQSIEKFSIDSGGASTTVNGIQIVYTTGEVVVQEISTSTISVSEGFINPSTNSALSIEDNPFSQFNITIYPNPTKQYINISTDLELTKIELYDVLGKQIFQSKLVDNPINLSTFEIGVYFLRLYKNDQSIVKRVIIE